MTAYHFYPPFNRGSIETHEQYNNAIREMAQRLNCVFADAYNAMRGCDHAVHQDTVHANKLVCLLIAHAVFAALAGAAPGLGARVRQRDEKTEWTKLIIAWQSEGVEPSDRSKPGE